MNPELVDLDEKAVSEKDSSCTDSNKISDLNCDNNGWNGKHQETERDLPSGVYLYEIYYQDFDGWKHQETGNVFIVR